MLVSIFSREGGLDGLNSFHVLYKEDVAAASSNSPTPVPILPCGIHVPWQSPPKWTGLTREPTAHWGNDGVWFLKLGPKRHCSFLCALGTLTPEEASCHVVRTLSPMEMSPWGRTEATHQQPALLCYGHVSEPSWKWSLLPQPPSWLQPIKYRGWHSTKTVCF